MFFTSASRAARYALAAPTVSPRHRIASLLIAAAGLAPFAAAQAATAPSVTTRTASGITATGATLRGTADAGSARTTLRFAYGKTTAYGSVLVPTPQRIPGDTIGASVSGVVTGLACGTTYHFVLSGSSRAGSDTGADVSFVTAACASTGTAPIATTGAAGSIAATAATLNATVTAGSAIAAISFDWGATTAYGSNVAATPSSAAAGSAATAATAPLAGLTCGTAYNFRAKATSTAGTATGANQSFTTAACASTATAPSVTTTAAAAIGTGSATVNGMASAGGASTTVTFEYGTTTSYGAAVAATPATIASTAQGMAIQASIAALACGTGYHYRAKGVNSAGTGMGADQAFTTAACAGSTASAWPWPTWTGKVIAVAPSTTGRTLYVDIAAGSDANAGTSLAAAFKTVAKAVAVVAAGDTVLIRKGLYREGINLSSAPSGTAAKPITFGSFGDGEVILDGSTKVGTWTQVSGTVWQSQASFKPVGVVVNEVPLRQVRQGQGGSSAPQEGIAGVTGGSGKWFVSSANLVTADFGATLGPGNPNSADIIVPNSNGGQEHVFWFGVSYVTFKGLTIRGSGSNGVWGYGSNVTVDSCDIKFNGKAAVSYLNDSAAGVVNADNAVINSHAYHNNLVNWPRGNNGYMEAGGGWPGTLVWETNLRPLARGNIVHMNGGEGIISYGTSAGHASGSALFEQNVAYDNWSVNMYFDNQPNNVARNNYLFNHPVDTTQLLYVGAYPYNSPGKFSVCLMLADEQNSSDSTNGYANLRGTKVYNNVLAGCRIGIRDYSEGTQSVANHGLKDTMIVNNTIVMGFNSIPNTEIFGIYLQDNKSPSGTQRNANTLIQNNVVYGFNQDAVLFSELVGAQGGVNLDFNNYFSTAARPFGSGYNTVTFYAFAGWKAATPGADASSKFADPQFLDVTRFRTLGPAVWDYAMAEAGPASPTVNAGTAQAFTPATNFRGVARSGWNIGAF
jgi:hypothetical protein